MTRVTVTPRLAWYATAAARKATALSLRSSDDIWLKAMREASSIATWTNGEPRRKTTAQWRSFDAALYKDRNLIERFFNKIKNFRRIATRCDKRARNHAGFLNLVAAIEF